MDAAARGLVDELPHILRMIDARVYAPSGTE